MTKKNFQAYGLDKPLIPVPHIAEFKKVAPTTTDRDFAIGDPWVYKIDNNTRSIYNFGGLNADGDAIWILTGGSSADVNTLSSDSGVASPISGDIKIEGFGNETKTSASGKTLIVSLADIVSFTRGNVSLVRTLAGGSVAFDVQNSDNTNVLSHSRVNIRAGGTSGGDPKVVYQNQPDGMGQNYSLGIDQSTTNQALVLSANNNLGTDDIFSYEPSTSVLSFVKGDVTTSREGDGVTVTNTISNTSNTALSSAAQTITVAGTSGGDPYTSWGVTGGQFWCAGLNNSGSDNFEINDQDAFAGTPAFTIDVSTLDVTVPTGNFRMEGPGKFRYMQSGSATDSVGSATLIGGAIAVGNTNIASEDLIFLSRSTTGGTEGTLSYVISDGVSFTINSSSGTDTSTIVYEIIKPL